MLVAKLAVDYAFRLLDHLKLEDNDGPEVPITNLEMGRLVIGNLLAAVRAHLVDMRTFAALQDDDDLEKLVADAPAPSGGWETEDAPTTSGGSHTADAAAQSSGLEIDSNTFTVRYKKGKPCLLGNKRMFHLLKRLAKAPGIYISIKILIDDVWHGKEVSDEAVQRQVSTLRTVLKAKGIDGIEINGSQQGHYRLILR